MQHLSASEKKAALALLCACQPFLIPPPVVMSATPEVRRKADQGTTGTANEAFESEDDDSAPSEGEGEDEDEVQELPKAHPAVEITPSLERATEEAMQTLNDALRRESLMMTSPEEEKPDPFVVAAVIHANGESR